VASDNEHQRIIALLEPKDGKKFSEQQQERVEKAIKTIEEAKELMGLITTPTWGLIEQHIDELIKRKGVRRKALGPDDLGGLAEIETDHVFRSGVEHGLRLFRTGIANKVKQIPILMESLKREGITLKEKKEDDR
jgi:hypothetical protein